MYECLVRLAKQGKLNKKLLDRALSKGWITKEQEEEILRIVAVNQDNGEGVNHDRANNG